MMALIDKTRECFCVLIGWSYIDTCMSGRPIIRNGKPVGAVAYVSVNDPQTGYGYD